MENVREKCLRIRQKYFIGYSDEYYLYENLYYKLKSASYTMFQYHFKLDVVNTRSNRREELILTKNKNIFWVSTKKIEISCEEGSFFIKLPSNETCYIENPVHLQAIKKYWNKATFYAVVPTTANDEPCPEIIMIEFNYWSVGVKMEILLI